MQQPSMPNIQRTLRPCFGLCRCWCFSAIRGMPAASWSGAQHACTFFHQLQAHAEGFELLQGMPVAEDAMKTLSHCLNADGQVHSSLPSSRRHVCAWQTHLQK